MTGERPLLVHLTTTDISLELLLGPQLAAFADHGYEVVGVSAPGPYVEALRRRGIEHVALPHATRAMSPRADVLALREFYGVLRRMRPAILHTHNPKPGVYGRIAGQAARVPAIVNTVHGLYATPDDRLARRALVYGLERVAALCSHAELVQNVEDLEVLRRLRIPEGRLVLLGNGIDLERFDPRNVDPADAEAARTELGANGPRDVVVGLVGRLVREKGYTEVFDAAHRLRASAPNVRIAIVGPQDHDKADALDAAEVDAARAVGVTFLGARDDIVRLYAGMDVYVLASHREGVPRSAMEAAAMGLPIVATDIRGCRQVVDDDVTGSLVPVRDAGALTRAVATLARDGELRDRLGRAGRRKAASEFDQQRCIDVTLDTYERLLARAAGPAAGVGS